jgi:hypothetical protein
MYRYRVTIHNDDASKTPEKITLDKLVAPDAEKARQVGYLTAFRHYGEDYLGGVSVMYLDAA